MKSTHELNFMIYFLNKLLSSNGSKKFELNFELFPLSHFRLLALIEEKFLYDHTHRITSYILGDTKQLYAISIRINDLSINQQKQNTVLRAILYALLIIATDNCS